MNTDKQDKYEISPLVRPLTTLLEHNNLMQKLIASTFDIPPWIIRQSTLQKRRGQKRIE